MPARLSSGLLHELVDVNCPVCDYGFELQMLDAACQVWRWCPCCRIRIHLSEGGGEVHGAMEDLDAAFSDLNKALRRQR